MNLRVYFLRHGQTTSSRANLFCGALDPELTPDGWAMAEAFAAAYRATPWTAIYTSPLGRARATAEPLARACGLTVDVRDGLREIAYGAWEGRTVEDVERTDHDAHLRWTADPGWHPPTGGETAVTIATRALAVVEEVQHRHADGHVLFVAHKATIRIVLCSLLGIDVGRFRYRLGCPVGSVSVVEFGANGPLLHALADRSHLDERLRNLPGT